MFAVIKTGGKQYKVASGDVLKIEKLVASPGENVEFNEVLMLGGDDVTVGSPFIEGAAVNAEVLEQGRGEKVINFKRRRRKHSSRRLKGHRQFITTVRVTSILANGAELSSAPAAAAPAPAEEAAPANEGTRPANLLDGPQGEADDLTQISGVGPGLNEKLNENGVFHFWQIAEWGPDEVTYMDDQLSFKGRIERDEWISQAKTLAAGAPDGGAETAE